MIGPLTPSNCDLQDFDYMPMLVAKLFSSEFHALSDDTTWRAGVTLWLKSWHQVPSASLPNDDIQLARIAEFGRDVKGWKKVRSAALRGWIECSDGRLYHPVVAERALEAWLEKLTQRIASGTGNAKRWGSDFDADSIKAQQEETLALLKALNPQSNAIAKYVRRQSQKRPTGNPERNPTGITSANETESQGKGKGKEEYKDTTLLSAGAISDLPDWPDARALAAECGPGMVAFEADPMLIQTSGEISLWKQQGFDLNLDVRPVLRAKTAQDRPRPINSWKFFTAAIQQAHADRTRVLDPAIAASPQPPKSNQPDALQAGAAKLIAEYRQ